MRILYRSIWKGFRCICTSIMVHQSFLNYDTCANYPDSNLFASYPDWSAFQWSKKKPYENFFSYDFMKYLFKSYTNSRTTSIAPSPLRRPILTILVYPPLRPLYFGAISVNNLSTKSTFWVSFFLAPVSVTG